VSFFEKNGDSPFRLSRVQVINWGVYHGYHDLEIDPGGTLITGSSGTGKSSLLDAISVGFLPPPYRNFNASGDRSVGSGSASGSRSMDKYIRGLIGEVADSNGKAKPAFLRSTTPTWSAIALTYSNGSGPAITGLVLKWLRSGQESKASTAHGIFRGPFDIKAVCDAWAQNNFNRAVFSDKGWETKAGDEGWYLTTLHSAVGLGGASSALSLLGKAKSLKSVGNLDTFIREYMLDEPEPVRDRISYLNQIEPLIEARDALTTAKRKLTILKGIDESYQLYVADSARLSAIKTLENATVVSWVNGQRLAMIPPRIDFLDVEIAKAESEAEEYRVERDSLDRKRTEVQRQIDAGTEGLVPLESKLEVADARLRQVTAARKRYDDFVNLLDFIPTVTEEDFSSLHGQIGEAVTSLESSMEESNREIYDLIAPAKRAAQDQLEAAQQNLKFAEDNQSSIPPDNARMRADIAEALNLSPAQLPYVCELVDVKPEKDRWRKMVEKTLRHAGLSLLVPERHHREVLRFVNSNNLHGYLRLEKVVPGVEPVDLHDNTLAGCLYPVDPSNECSAAAVRVIRKAGGYALVDHPDQFELYDRAVTAEGLRKENSTGSVKDDRGEMSRASYIFIVNIVDKIDALRANLVECERRFDELKTTMTLAMESHETQRRSKSWWEGLKGFESFSDIDVGSAETVKRALTDEINELKANNPDIPRLESQSKLYFDQMGRLAVKIGALEIFTEDHTAERKSLRSVQSNLRADPVDAKSAETLESYAADLTVELDLEDGREYIEQLWKFVTAAQDSLRSGVDKLRGKMEDTVAIFDENFPQSIIGGGGVDQPEDGFADYVKLYVDIKDRGIDEAAVRMQQVITEQAPGAIFDLHRLVNEEINRIHDQIAQVNLGLASVEFDTGTELELRAEEKDLAEVKEFNNLVKRIRERIVLVSMKDPEAVFHQLEDIITLRNLLTVGTADNREWASKALDVRKRLTFSCWEFYKNDESRSTPREIYLGSASKSGGEQEKLMAFCLAGALSYNLADHSTGSTSPVFAQLLVDEAFSKSDPDFAREALSAFRSFGFQLVIVAVVQNTTVIEGFIGSVAMVGKNKNNRRASVQNIPVYRLGDLRRQDAARVIAGASSAQ
jgi:uncharacterized protein YPO0396